MTEKKIIHIDMDCFFAAIEMLDNPELRGKPMAVGGQAGTRGVLCTANYEARKFGVHSALSSNLALKRCPELIIVKPRSYRYREVSQEIQKIFYEYTDTVEMLSLDEGFLDVTDYCHKHQVFATKVAAEIREKIFLKTSLTASAGIANNKFLAKVSSDWNKPNGQWVIPPEKAAEFSYQLELGKVPGIGEKTLEKCHTLGIFKLGDIREKGVLWAKDHFGKFGHSLYQKSWGISSDKVGRRSQRKSISCERTFSQDLKGMQEIEEYFPFLLNELEERIITYYEKIERKKAEDPLLYSPPIKKLFIKMKTKDFKNHTHEFISPIEEPWTLKSFEFSQSKIFEQLGHSLYTQIGRPAIRLLGIGVKLNYTQSDELEGLGQLRLL